MTELFDLTIDNAAAVHMTAAVIVVLVGAGVVLYERFSQASRRLALPAGILGLVLLSYGMNEATSGQAAELWNRMALAMDALLAPAVYALAIELVQVRRPRLKRLAWSGGFLLAAWSLASPTLLSGVRQIGSHRLLAGDAWAGSLFLVFLICLLAAAIGELVWSYRSATHPDDRRRALTLAAGFAIGSLGMIDFFVAADTLTLTGITPFAVTIAVLVFIYAAMRFRAFSPLPAFAADRILQVMGDGVLLCDARGRIRSANRAACSLTGLAADELTGVHVSTVFRDASAAGSDHTSLLPPRHEAGLAPALDQEIRDREMILARHDGSTTDVSLSSEPLRQTGRIVGSLVVFRDISERLRATRELLATEQRYHSLFWNNPALVYEVACNGSIIEVNRTVERMLGYTVAEMKRHTFRDYIFADDMDYAVEVFGRVLQGTAEEYRFRLVTAAGTTLEVKGVSIPVVRDGVVVSVFGVALDITEEERVRRELELQRLEFVELFEASPEAMLVTDDDDVIVRVNPEFTRTFGYQPEQALGRRVDDLLVPADRAEEGARLAAAARRGEVVRAETVRRCRDGSLINVSLLARELRLPGRAPQLYGIYRDITSQRLAQQALHEREEQLRHAQRLESVGKLAGGVAHDFNNLVTVIIGHAGFALEQLPDDHPARLDLEQIECAGHRAASLTQQLLAFSRRQLLRPETVDAAAIIADVRRMLDRIIGEHIRFETSHEDTAFVRADRGQLEQLLVNLVVNARDAMPAGGLLTITTDRTVLPDAETNTEGWDVEPGEYVRITVADTGTGMDEATLARIFDPFFTTKEQGKGTGLGLATVFGIAKQSGGHVTAASRLGHGTTIRVWLPGARMEEALDTKQAPAAQPPAAPASTPPAGNGTRVLVVEDEAALRDLAARFLRRTGHEVLLASDGVEALAIAAQTRLDVVVSDLIMPHMGGRELARRLRHAYPELPIILMSGYDDEIGAGDPDERILTKPFTPAELTTRVEVALTGARLT
jgi:two-component system, cell cycle sensor histidine kinase and response regulator CckA